jgi:hypothetical protein
MDRRFTHHGARNQRPGNVQAVLAYWRKLAWLGAAAIVLLAGDSALLKFGPPAFVTALVRAWRTADVPTVATGASFSVSAASFATEAKAATFAAALDASGLPILVRMRAEDSRYQVLVGPYVSTEEAEHAQRALAAWGLGESRFVVDDAMRATTRASIFGSGRASNGIVLVSAPGMSSLVFEMANRPSNVEARRTSATTIELEIGSARARVNWQGRPVEALALPDGVSLIRDVAVQSDPESGLRSRVVVPADVKSRLRLEGHRVYLDLALPKAPWAIRGVPQPAVGAAPGYSGAPAPAPHDDLGDIVTRLVQVEPFIVSGADAPDSDVLAALDHALEEIRGSLEAIAVPAVREPERQALLASVVRASNAMAPSFIGDRAAEVREASFIWRSTAPPSNP